MLAKALRRWGPGCRRSVGASSVLAVTYVAYAICTAARLPYAIAKSALNPEHPSSEAPGWMPFNGPHGQMLLGSLDTLYMLGYAMSMPFMGMVADRVNAAHFLACALLMIGVLLVAIGQAHTMELHSFYYFGVLTFLGGCAQSIAYPCVIVVVNRWFGGSNIGTILGFWGSCTPAGTILGKFGATAALRNGWQCAFIYPGVVVCIFAIVVGLFLLADPHDVNLPRSGEEPEVEGEGTSVCSLVLTQEGESADITEEEPVPLCKIIRIPGLVSYCCATFFSKFSYYAFVFWLPYYLDHGLGYSPEKAGEMSTFFDYGGFTGGVVGGFLIDRLKIRGPVLLCFQILTVPMLFLYLTLGNYGLLTDTTNAMVLVGVGFTVTTPYSLMTSVMACTLSKHPCLEGNTRASGTVTAILDGTGSFGAVVQGVLIGWISARYGWQSTFHVLMIFGLLSAGCLLRPSIQELRSCRPASRRSLGGHPFSCGSG